eukprot:CAMPEP_0177644114 /NCGR_PEP_ID=MMETSP0447-20121125/8508_1 /TAXON_ID=0 /ORGANISM="Stygamoeba regulata, Strain BSH-02190019" /LENGTH=322 /DNA_ID=CAMNT_0019146439 /DNA_START=35 /DNA_END=1003 /DNA_ORIENTATION=-
MKNFVLLMFGALLVAACTTEAVAPDCTYDLANQCGLRMNQFLFFGSQSHACVCRAGWITGCPTSVYDREFERYVKEVQTKAGVYPTGVVNFFELYTTLFKLEVTPPAPYLGYCPWNRPPESSSSAPSNAVPPRCPIQQLKPDASQPIVGPPPLVIESVMSSPMQLALQAAKQAGITLALVGPLDDVLGKKKRDGGFSDDDLENLMDVVVMVFDALGTLCDSTCQNRTGGAPRKDPKGRSVDGLAIRESRALEALGVRESSTRAIFASPQKSQIQAFVQTMKQHAQEGRLEFYAGVISAPSTVKQAYKAEMLSTLNANCDPHL